MKLSSLQISVFGTILPLRKGDLIFMTHWITFVNKYFLLLKLKQEFYTVI